MNNISGIYQTDMSANEDTRRTVTSANNIGMNQYSAEFYYQYPLGQYGSNLPTSKPVSHLSSSHAKIANMMSETTGSAPLHNRAMIGGGGAGGLQLNIINSAADKLNNSTVYSHIQNIKVQKNLVRLKEVAQHNQQQPYYSSNLVNASMILPSGTHLEDLNNSFISGGHEPHGYHNNISQIRVKQLKSS